MPPQDQTKQAKFSEVETQFLLAYIRNLTSTPQVSYTLLKAHCIFTSKMYVDIYVYFQVNWDAVAKERGYDKVSSAQKYFSKLRIKHGINMQTEGKQPISPQKRRVGNTPKRAAREVKKSKVAGSDGSPAPTDDFDSGTEEDEF
ncbi:uncharacterized protein PAC_03569 [Phialocephala subalpina]|uniref:Uncharacterized protein n=1 Tax=Phialocephala subalpina TaxID=576137 RepID=A0A1L7WLN7_9HELO|nr:uncharacterized protein PAC_03569 [Phialocephala subalpina]